MARLAIAVLVFFIVRVSFDIAENQKEEVLLHDFYKYKVFSVKKGDKACFWLEENSDKQKVVKYIINPYTSSRRLAEVEIKTFPGAVKKVIYNDQAYHIK